MKNLLLFSICLFMISCSKNSDENDVQIEDDLIENRGMSAVKWLDPNATYILNGTQNFIGSQLEPLTTEDYSFLPNYKGDNLVFSNDANLRSWTFGHSDRTRVREVLDSINYFETLENTSNGPATLSALLSLKGWLWMDTNNQGTAWPLSSPSYLGLNNTASSFFILFSGAVICDRTWFRGRRLWLLGIPGNVGNLNNPAFNFNDRAESGWNI